MISEELRKRISELNRKEIRVWPLGSPPPGKGTLIEPPEINKETVTAILGGEEVCGELGQFLKISHLFRNLQINAGRFLDRYQFVFQKGGFSKHVTEMHNDILQFLKTSYDKIIYLDIETCGLASSPIFLVGLMYPTVNDFTIEQLFARDYTEEPPLLAYLQSLMERFDVLVTFNGKTFDYPYLRERGLLHRIFFNPDLTHFDLLHESRRRWKELLQDCKLKTIERHILKRQRSGDVPSDEIPEIYHEYVRTGKVARIKNVIQHNLLDIISMSELALYMVAGREEE